MSDFVVKAAMVVVLVLSTTGCKSDPKEAAVGEKCDYGTPQRLPCAAELWCEPQREASGELKTEKVGVDKTSAVGICRARSKAGGPCSADEACAEGKCTFSAPGDKMGVCKL